MRAGSNPGPLPFVRTRLRDLGPLVKLGAVFPGVRPMLRKGTWSLAVLACMVMLVGCNTIAGMGKDVQKVGEKVEEKAQDCKDAKC
jgi:predicted small secreted protein